MATESLLYDIYPEVVKEARDYCRICFRTSKESLLHDGKSLYKFNFFRNSTNKLEFLNTNSDKYDNEKLCYMCEAAAIAATKFCIAVNLSHKLHMLFNKMKQQYSFQRLVQDHLTSPHLQQAESQVKYNNNKVSDLQAMLVQYRRSTTLLQSDTLLLNSLDENGDVGRTDAAPATPAMSRGSRDLLTYETQSGDEGFLHMNDSDIVSSEIVIEDDDPPDNNVFIIPDELPATTPTHTQTDIPTDLQNRYILHPILLNNGTITIPSLDKHLTINDTNFIEDGLVNNAHMSSIQQPLTTFLVNQLPQNTSNTKIVSNLSVPNLNYIQNTNSLAKNIVSLVKSQQNMVNSQQNMVNFVQNTTNLVPLTLNTSNLSQNTSNGCQNTVKSTQNYHLVPPNLTPIAPALVKNISSAKIPLNPVKVTSEAVKLSPKAVKLSPKAVKLISGAVKLTSGADKLTSGAVKLTSGADKLTSGAVKLTSGAVKRPDSDFDSSDYCHTKLPIRKEDGTVDWEDKIPMDVISFVSPSDPAMAVKRQKVGCCPGFVSHASTVFTSFMDQEDYRDPMDKCVITDVKSVTDEVIDLC